MTLARHVLTCGMQRVQLAFRIAILHQWLYTFAGHLQSFMIGIQIHSGQDSAARNQFELRPEVGHVQVGHIGRRSLPSPT